MTQTSDNKLVLIVDDTPTNVGVISGVLKGVYRTKVATNGEKALVLASAAEKPDLILLDVMMPGMDGYEVCRRLKANPVTRDIPVIFLTAKTDALDEENGFEVGAVDYIHKPFSGPIVLARVRTQLALQAALAQAREARNQADELLHALLPKKAADEIRSIGTVIRGATKTSPCCSAMSPTSPRIATSMSRKMWFRGSTRCSSFSSASRRDMGSKRSRPSATASWRREGCSRRSRTQSGQPSAAAWKWHRR
jgi:CheY-like chemotaxis protein